MDGETLRKILREERTAMLAETQILITKNMEAHEEREERMHEDTLEKLTKVLSDEHAEEHSFVRSWMTRMDNMGEGFFSSIGKFLALGLLFALGAAALITMGSSAPDIIPKP